MIESVVLTKMDKDLPVRGFRISPSDIGANGHNFRYCDGSTGLEDLEEFSAIGEECDEGGWALNHNEVMDGLRGARVYTSASGEYRPIGSVSGMYGTSDGKFVIETDDGDLVIEFPDVSQEPTDLVALGIEIVQSKKGELEVILDQRLVPNQM